MKSVIHYGTIVVMCASMMASSLVISACAAISPDGDDGPAAQGSHTGKITQALTGTHKVCSAINPSNWRDSIEVDDGWSGTTCQGWATSLSAPQWQLGCLFTNGFSWGSVNGGIPSPNCGW